MRKLQVSKKVRTKSRFNTGENLEVAHRMVPGMESLYEIAARRETLGSLQKILFGLCEVTIGA
jgi:hypothetical protein